MLHTKDFSQVPKAIYGDHKKELI